MDQQQQIFPVAIQHIEETQHLKKLGVHDGRYQAPQTLGDMKFIINILDVSKIAADFPLEVLAHADGQKLDFMFRTLIASNCLSINFVETAIREYLYEPMQCVFRFVFGSHRTIPACDEGLQNMFIRSLLNMGNFVTRFIYEIHERISNIEHDNKVNDATKVARAKILANQITDQIIAHVSKFMMAPTNFQDIENSFRLGTTQKINRITQDQSIFTKFRAAIGNIVMYRDNDHNKEVFELTLCIIQLLKKPDLNEIDRDIINRRINILFKFTDNFSPVIFEAIEFISNKMSRATNPDSLANFGFRLLRNYKTFLYTDVEKEKLTFFDDTLYSNHNNDYNKHHGESIYSLFDDDGNQDMADDAYEPIEINKFRDDDNKLMENLFEPTPTNLLDRTNTNNPILNNPNSGILHNTNMYAADIYNNRAAVNFARDKYCLIHPPIFKDLFSIFVEHGLIDNATVLVGKVYDMLTKQGSEEGLADKPTRFSFKDMFQFAINSIKPPEGNNQNIDNELHAKYVIYREVPDLNQLALHISFPYIVVAFKRLVLHAISRILGVKIELHILDSETSSVIDNCNPVKHIQPVKILVRKESYMDNNVNEYQIMYPRLEGRFRPIGSTVNVIRTNAQTTGVNGQSTGVNGQSIGVNGQTTGMNDQAADDDDYPYKNYGRGNPNLQQHHHSQGRHNHVANLQNSILRAARTKNKGGGYYDVHKGRLNQNTNYNYNTSYYNNNYNYNRNNSYAGEKYITLKPGTIII